MTRWISAFVVASAIGLLITPAARERAFYASRFARVAGPRPCRSEGHPTLAGLVLALALAAGTLIAGPSRPVVHAIVAASAIAIVAGLRAEKAATSPWMTRLGRVGAAIALPASGVQAGLTGGTTTDAFVTAVLALAVMRGLRSIERSDGASLFVAAIAAGAFLMISVRAGDPAAPAAAAVLGAAAMLAALSWRPANLQLGAIGPTALGASLTAVAVALQPAVSAPRSTVVPALVLATLATAVALPAWDRRLARRGISPRVALSAAALTGAVAAERLAVGAIGLWPAIVVAAVPVAALAAVAIATPRTLPDDESRRPGRTVAIVAAGALVVGAVAVIAAVLLVDAKRSMVDGREAAIGGLDAARAGDLERAQALFDQADTAFFDASRSLNNPIVRLGDVLPAIGPNLRGARALADVGRQLSSTAVAVAERAGADDLVMVDGRFPVKAARQVSAQLSPALDTLRRATERLAELDSPLLVADLREATDAMAASVADATNSIEVAAEATRLAPALLGADREQRWMVAILAPVEQRGAGGIAGDYAEVFTRDGGVGLVRSMSAIDLNRATDEAAQLGALPAIYAERYSGFFPGRLWQNLSATPDVPSFGQAVAAAYPLTTGGGPVDGVIVIDPEGLAALLQITGPVTVPEWPEPLSADNVSRVLLFEQYDRLTGVTHDTFQQAVVAAVVDALTRGSLPPPPSMAAALAPAVAGGHLRLWSPDRDTQALFTRIGADGALGGPSDADFVQLVTQNSAENKLDWFLHRTLTYEPTFDPSTGSLTAKATITARNEAPTSGLSEFILGSMNGLTSPGEARMTITLFSRLKPTGATDAAGEPLAINVGTEKGLWSLSVVVRIPSDGTATVRVDLAGALAPADRYRLTIGHQPTVVADLVTVHLNAPHGWTPGRDATVVTLDKPTAIDIGLSPR